MDINERIKEIEDEIEKTPYNKASQQHIGKLKAKLSHLREKLIKASSKKGSGVGFGVKKTGHATAILIGLPSVGKSTLLNRITNAQSEVGSYDFTTLDVVPGMLQHKDLNVQILDLPGIIVGASRGKGRGREVLSMVRNTDLIIIMLDIFRTDVLEAIKKELYGVGVRLDQKPPNVSIKKMLKGGVTLTTTIKNPKLDIEEARAVLNEYGIHNADVTLRQNIDVDQFIDAGLGNREYKH